MLPKKFKIEERFGITFLGQDSRHRIAGAGQRDKIAKTGQPGQDGNQRRQSGWYIQDRKQRTGLPKHYSNERTARGGQIGQDKGIGQLWQDSWDRFIWD